MKISSPSRMVIVSSSLTVCDKYASREVHGCPTNNHGEPDFEENSIHIERKDLQGLRGSRYFSIASDARKYPVKQCPRDGLLLCFTERWIEKDRAACHKGTNENPVSMEKYLVTETTASLRNENNYRRCREDTTLEDFVSRNTKRFFHKQST